MGTPDCSSVLRRNVASMALQASLAFSSPTSSSPLSLRVARSLLAATPSPTPLPSPGQIRFKRVNIQKPRRPDWFRQQLLAVAAPRFSQPQRAELSTLLSFNQRKTLSLLGANQQSLSTNLDQYVK